VNGFFGCLKASYFSDTGVLEVVDTPDGRHEVKDREFIVLQSAD